MVWVKAFFLCPNVTLLFLFPAPPPPPYLFFSLLFLFSFFFFLSPPFFSNKTMNHRLATQPYLRVVKMAKPAANYAPMRLLQVACTLPFPLRWVAQRYLLLNTILSQQRGLIWAGYALPMGRLWACHGLARSLLWVCLGYAMVNFPIHANWKPSLCRWFYGRTFWHIRTSA